METKLATVRCNNSRVMNSLETASISVTSPTGKEITLYKIQLGRPKCTEAMAQVFWKCCKDPMINFVGDVQLTIEEMRLALEFSKLGRF